MTSELAEQHHTTWTGVRLQDILRETKDRAEWRRIIRSAVNPRTEED